MAFKSSQILSTPASHSTPTHWDVFLSFCGEDTRYKFTSHLYAALDRHGIRTFKDDAELRSGEVISGTLLDAINKSKTYIVVISENYASSHWCLDELVEILNCYKTMRRLVIPVFYNIDTSVPRHQIGCFKEAFEKHRIGSGIETVNKWSLALTEVVDFSGYHISENRSEADAINEIVEAVLLEINPNTLDVAKYPVGLDSCVKRVTAFLSSDNEGVIMIGIYGMGGIGKTTLAKALYNQLLVGSFNGSCFLAKVSEVSRTANGLVSLQQRLLNDVLKSKKIVEVHNVDHGTKLMGARICSLKVLVVIDNLDDHKQFEYLVGTLASGSVVIITTRDEEILDRIEIDTKYRYMVEKLDDAESLDLFTRHAFGKAEPTTSLRALTKDILRHAGGLPLALEVFGSYLYNRPEAGWNSFIEKLHRYPSSSVQQRLITSLDAVELDDPMLKKIFLDIACFFIGWKKAKVVKILETYYCYADHKINSLKKRCLVTTNNRDELEMHDLLRDMGREIARNNSPDDPGKHNRLWVLNDICDVLKKSKGTEAIEVIIPRNYCYQDAFKGVSFTAETFRTMSKLRFLFLSDVNFIGSFEQTFEDLRWLRWVRYPLKCLPSDFYPQKLVILELPHSKMTRIWEKNVVPQAFDNLKTLNMFNSSELTTTPDFTRLPCLETLNFEHCVSLEEVHISIGSLVRLLSLNMSCCVKLISLPDSICNLRALTSLNIGNCRTLKALPTELGNIESLKELNAECLIISRLPDSIGRLSKLVDLKLSYNYNLETLPDTICNLSALELLDISNCSSLKALPNDLGNIESLKVLNARRLTVSKLPDSIGRLNKLVELRLSYNKNLETFPDTIRNLRSLKIVDIYGCKELEILQDHFGRLQEG